MPTWRNKAEKSAFSVHSKRKLKSHEPNNQSENRIEDTKISEANEKYLKKPSRFYDVNLF